jgi:hypothetical protein
MRVNRLLEKLLEIRIGESSIDYPQSDLDLSIWDKEDDKYKIKPTIKEQLLDILSKYPDDLGKIVKSENGVIKIIGSICTNQYQNISDFDIHITIPKDSKLFGNKEFQDKVEDWFDENRDEIHAYIGEHPITVFIQYDPEHELMLADGCYDLMSDRWIKGPKKVPMDYDPYEDFSGVFNEFIDLVKDADELFGELRRDIIDYEIIKQAINQLSGDQRSKVLNKLEIKFKEIESDIEELYKERKEWTNARKEASKSVTIDMAKKDIDSIKGWNDANAIFKFIARYQYLKIIEDLKKTLDKDDEIDQEDVKDIKATLNKQTDIGPVV